MLHLFHTSLTHNINFKMKAAFPHSHPKFEKRLSYTKYFDNTIIEYIIFKRIYKLYYPKLICMFGIQNECKMFKIL